VQCERSDDSVRPADSVTESVDATESAAVPGAELAADALQHRPSKMFVAGSGRVRESGEGAAAEQATNGLVKLAFGVVEKADGILALPAIERKARLGYSLDDEEAVGYLLGDAINHPLESDGARAVSKRAARQLKVITKRLPEIASTARKAARKAGSCAEKAAADAQAAYLREPFDLKCRVHPRRAPPQPPQMPPPPPPPPRSRKRARPTVLLGERGGWRHFTDGPYTPEAVAVAAANAQDREIGEAMKLTEVAELAEVAARSKLAKAEAALDGLPSTAQYLLQCPSLQARSKEKMDHAWATYNTVWQAHEDAVAAVNSARDAVEHACELHDRMERWLARPNRVTPFPWLGGEFIEPCNDFDLAYYSGRPDAYPPGVREWQERFESYVYDGPCMCSYDTDTCIVCCPENVGDVEQ
jgi:hypothetical protein